MIVFVLILGYTTQKMNIWIMRDDIDIMSTRKELYYGEEYVMDTR